MIRGVRIRCQNGSKNLGRSEVNGQTDLRSKFPKSKSGRPLVYAYNNACKEWNMVWDDQKSQDLVSELV